MKVCAKCGNKIGRRDRFCGKCGCSMFNETSLRSKYCLYCGETLDAKAKFCSKCGKSCEGEISLSFLSEKKEVPADIELDFLKTPEQLAKEAQEREAKEAEERAAKEAEEKAHREAEERVLREAEEKARQRAEEKAKKDAEARARVEAEIKARKEAEEKAKKEAEEKARLAEEKARKEAEEKAKKEAEEKARIEAEIKARKEAEEKAKKEAEEKARLAEEKARKEAEEKAKKEAEEKARIEAEIKARKEAEEKAKKEAEEKARLAEEKARKEAEEKARKEAEEKARKEAEEKARKEAEEKARKEAEEKARKEAEEKAKREAEEKARKEAEEKARREKMKKDLVQLNQSLVENGSKTLEKEEKAPGSMRTHLEELLDQYSAVRSLYDACEKDDQIDISEVDLFDAEEIYLDIAAIMGVVYYRERAYKLALPLLKDAVKADKPCAMIYYADYLIRNRTEIPDEPEYIKNFIVDAVSRGEIKDSSVKIKALKLLAKIYKDGITVKKDLTETFNYYMQCAQQNDAEAQALVGNCYMYAEGVKKDGKQALEWNTKSANKNCEMGIRNLAICYDFGIGTKRDGLKAAENYERLLSMSSNDRFANYRMAVCLADPDKEYKHKPTDDMYEVAVTCAKKALNGGEENANYVLGYCYMLGKGLPKDLDKAVAHFTKASNNGNSKAAEKLKLFTRNGVGKYILK